MPPATSVFVGGGTPSLVPADDAGRRAARDPGRPDAEVTVECNPDDVTEALIGRRRRAGVNRVSIGVQSMVPHVLAALGRTHDPANVERAVAAVRTVGLLRRSTSTSSTAPSGRRGRLAHHAAAGLGLEPPHVSAYASPSRPGTPLAADPPATPTTTSGRRVRDRRRLLDGAGLANYEVSNWAVPARVPPQPPLLGATTTAASVRRPLAPGRPAVVEPAHAGALHRRRRRRPLDEAAGETLDRRPPRRGPAAGAAHPAVVEPSRRP